MHRARCPSVRRPGVAPWLGAVLLGAVTAGFALAQPAQTTPVIEPPGAPAKFDAQAAAREAATLLRLHYVLRPLAEPLGAALDGEAALTRFDGMDRDRFARAATVAMRAVANDQHLFIEPAIGPAPAAAEGDSDDAARERERRRNHGFERVQVLPGNIGYLRISAFMDPHRGLATANAAMHFVRHTRALVIDLRGNEGGPIGLPQYLASYFFGPEPTLLSTTIVHGVSGTIEQVHTVPAVAGARRTGTPLFVLVDGRTGGSAEWLAYTLQAFEKATVVGERSLGSANRATVFELAQGLRLSISTATPVSPVTLGNWEATGVLPDVPCEAARALDCALQKIAPP